MTTKSISSLYGNGVKNPLFSDQADTVMSLLDSLLRTRSPQLSDYSVEDDPEQVGSKENAMAQLVVHWFLPASSQVQNCKLCP